MGKLAYLKDTEVVEFGPAAAVLDRNQLREITLDDEALMRDILSALVDDTLRQIPLLDAAIRDQDSTRCMHLAHYSKGACANLGAESAAAILKEIEVQAGRSEFPACQVALVRLAEQVELLRHVSAAL